jgi:histidinol-phosphate aminotransferase
MTLPRMSRRGFAGALGAAIGATVLRDPWNAAAEAGSATPAPPLVRLDSNENPYGPSEAARAAMTRSQSVACRYPDAEEDAVVAAIARQHAVKPEQVVLGCGSGDVLRMADAAFVTAGRTVVAAEPTFEAVLLYASLTTGEPVKVALTADHRHDLKAMAAACDARTGLVYVCNPNNPTGTIVSGDELEAFLAAVPPTAVALVDEAYHHFVDDPRYRSADRVLARFPNLVVIRTFSKIYGMAGMRLGYALASEANAKALRARASFSIANAAVLAAALASLEDPALVGRQKALLNGTRRRLCDALAKDGRRFIPSQANFVMIDVGTDVEPLIKAFRERNVAVGRKFPAMPQWLRITIGTPEETDAFLAALRVLAPARAAA